jgi:hypothetical protein
MTSSDDVTDKVIGIIPLAVAAGLAYKFIERVVPSDRKKASKGGLEPIKWR